MRIWRLGFILRKNQRVGMRVTLDKNAFASAHRSPIGVEYDVLLDSDHITSDVWR